VIEALDVLFPLPVPPFRYLAPLNQPGGPLGARVVVPWQDRVRIGIVVGKTSVEPTRAGDLREAIGWLDSTSHLQEGACQLILDLAQITATPAGLVLSTIVKSGLNSPLNHAIRAVDNVDLEALTAETWRPVDALEPRLVDLWRKQGLIEERITVRPHLVRVLEVLKSPDEALSGKRQSRQLKALNHLLEKGRVESVRELAKQAGVTEGAIRGLVKKGYVGYVEVPESKITLPPLERIEIPTLATKPLILSERSFLSGGTRLARLSYLLQTIKTDLQVGAGVMVLVPERSQLEKVAGVLSTAGLPVFALSGERSDRQREYIWRELYSDKPCVLVTTYLGLLAPLRNLGRIVVLDVSSPTYKLDSGPRIVTPRVAEMLADQHKIPLVLEDILETAEWVVGIAQENRHQIVRPKRRQFVTPLSESLNWPLGADLIRVLKQVKDRNRQAVIIVPRRGYSAALGCRACGHILMCPNCDLSLRYHREETRLRCHQCEHTDGPPKCCPSCGEDSLDAVRGPGTQWVTSEIKRFLSDFRVARFDADHRDSLDEFHEGCPGVVVGTTALLRIAPLPNLALIGVTLFESFLAQGDFRAEEAALRFLLALDELSLAGQPLVVIQAFDTDHAVIEVAAKPTKESMAKFGVAVEKRRARFGYPPFGHLARVQLSGRYQNQTREAAYELATKVDNVELPATVYGPAPAPVARQRGRYVYNLLIRTETRSSLGDLLRETTLGPGAGIKARIDIDPYDIGEFLE
jgi:primosomal protein N' (replication factor Y)